MKLFADGTSRPNGDYAAVSLMRTHELGERGEIGWNGPTTTCPFVNCLQQRMNQTGDYHFDPSSIRKGRVHSIDGLKWFTTIHNSPRRSCLSTPTNPRASTTA